MDNDHDNPHPQQERPPETVTGDTTEPAAHVEKSQNTQSEASKTEVKKKTAPRRSTRKKAEAAPLPVPGVLNMRDLAGLPDVMWLVDNLLMLMGVSVLHGAPGSLKSFVALHIAGCVAYGMPLLPGGEPCERGLVLYLAFEGITAFKARRRAWLRFQKLTEPDLDALKLINPRKERIENVEGINFDLSDPAKIGKLIALAHEISRLEGLPIRLIVIDVLKEALKDGIESVKTFRQAAEFARMIADALRTQVLLLHHNRSNSEEMRGPTSLEGAIETRLLLKRDGSRLALKVAKNREGDSGYTIAMRSHKMTLGATTSDRPISSLAIEVMGVVEDASIEDVSLARLVQIASAMKPGEPLTMAVLIRLLGWSPDGRGGKQREWVRAALDGATAEKPIVVHLGGDHYRRLWLGRIAKHEYVFCEAIDPSEAKEAAQMAKSGVEPEITPALKMPAKKTRNDSEA